MLPTDLPRHHLERAVPSQPTEMRNAIEDAPSRSLLVPRTPPPIRLAIGP